MLWRTTGASNVTGACEAARNRALQDAYPVDLWGINAPECRVQEPVNVTGLGPAGWLPLDGDITEGVEPLEVQPPLGKRPGGIPQPFYDACYAWRLWGYLNREEVQEALNAIQVGQPPPVAVCDGCALMRWRASVHPDACASTGAHRSRCAPPAARPPALPCAAGRGGARLARLQPRH